MNKFTLRRSLPLLAVIVVGCATAFFRLGAKGLWGDEVWEVWWSGQQPLWQTFLRFRTPPDLPLHFMLTQVSTSVAENEFFARLPAALLGAGTVLLVFLLGRRVFGTATGLVGALLLALAPYHVWYAQDARPYAGLAFYSILSLFFFWNLLRSPSVGAWIGFTVATTLNVYNHLFGLFSVLIEIAAVLAWLVSTFLQALRKDRTTRASLPGKVLVRLGAVVSGAVASLILSLPLAQGILTYLRQGGPGEVEAPPFQITWDFVTQLFGLFGSGQGLALWLVGILFGVGLAVGLLRRRAFAWMALLWLGLPILILWIAQPRHIFIPRYFLFMQPVYMLVVGYGLVWIADCIWRGLGRLVSIHRQGSRVRAGLRSAAVLLVAIFIMGPTISSYWIVKVNDWSAICGYMQKNLKPGDVVTGDSYFEGIMDWCLSNVPDVTIASLHGPALRDILQSGRTIWYLQIDPNGPDKDFVVSTFTRVPTSAWAKQDLQFSYADASRLAFPQAEYLAQVYRYHSVATRTRIEFHDVHTGDPNTPDYAQIGPGGRYAVPLAVPPCASSRVLRLTFFDLAGRDLDLYVNQVLVARIKAGATGGKWVTQEYPLPNVQEGTASVVFANPGKEISAVSAVEIACSNEQH